MRLLRTLINDSVDDEDGFLSTKTVRLSAVAICVVAEIIAIFFTDALEFAFGLFLGGSVAQLLFRQHELSINKIFSKGGNGRADYFLRLIIRGVTLYIAITNRNVSIIGCIAGLLSISYGIYLAAFVNAFILRKRKEVQDD